MSDPIEPVGEALVLLGRDHVEKGRATIRAVTPRIVAATTAGEGVSLNPKLVPNEDALAVVPLAAGGVAALVADSHFGATASEVVVRCFAERMAADGTPGSADALAMRLLDIDEAIARGMPAGESSATTALAVVIAGGRLLWASVGDSLLFLRAPPSHELQRLDRATPVFMSGDLVSDERLRSGQIAIERIVSSGEVTVAPGDLALIASDGIEPLASGMTVERLSAVMAHDAPLAQRVENLMTEGGRSAYGGGRDNLTVVAIEIE